MSENMTSLQRSSLMEQVQLTTTNTIIAAAAEYKQRRSDIVQTAVDHYDGKADAKARSEV